MSSHVNCVPSPLHLAGEAELRGAAAETGGGVDQLHTSRRERQDDEPVAAGEPGGHQGASEAQRPTHSSGEKRQLWPLKFAPWTINLPNCEPRAKFSCPVFLCRTQHWRLSARGRRCISSSWRVSRTASRPRSWRCRGRRRRCRRATRRCRHTMPTCRCCSFKEAVNTNKNYISAFRQAKFYQCRRSQICVQIFF